MRREARASRGRSPSRDRARPRGARRSARRAVRSAQGHRIRPLRLRSRGAGALGGVALVRQRGPARPGERDAQGAVRRPGGAGQPARAALARLPPRRAGRPHPRGGGGALLRRRAAAHRARRGAGRVRHPRRGQAGQRDRRRSPADQRRSDALRGAAAPRRRGLLQPAELLRSPARFAGLAGAGGGALGERTVFRVGPRRPGDEQRGALCRGRPARRAGHLGSAQRRRGAPALGGAGKRGRGAGDRAAPRRCAHRAGSGERLAARVRVRAGVPARAGAPAARAARGRARVEGTGARPRRGRPVRLLALGPGRPPGRGLDPPRGVDLRGGLRPDPQRAGPLGRLARPVGRQGVRRGPLGAAGTRAAALPHQPPGDHRRFRRLQRRARGDLLMRAVLLGALAACAASAGALDDPMFYLHDDTYQLTPARLAQWEAGQLAQRGNAWIDLGSIEGGEYDAVERGVVNLDLASRFSLHAELRNDRDSQGRVTRVVADLLVNVAPGLWLGASGVPAARKQDYGVGGSVLVASASRRRYLLARVVADQFLYNRTNLDGWTRGSTSSAPTRRAPSWARPRRCARRSRRCGSTACCRLSPERAGAPGSDCGRSPARRSATTTESPTASPGANRARGSPRSGTTGAPSGSWATRWPSRCCGGPALAPPWTRLPTRTSCTARAMCPWARSRFARSSPGKSATPASAAPTPTS